MSERLCLDVNKPFRCPPHMMCHGFTQYCDTHTKTVEPCFPTLSNPLHWCRQYVQGLETLINPQCQFACQFTFNTSELYQQEVDLEYTSNTSQYSQQCQCPEAEHVEKQDGLNTWFLLCFVFGGLFLLSFVVNIVFIVILCHKKKTGYYKLAQFGEDYTLKEIPTKTDEEPAGRNHVESTEEVSIKGSRVHKLHQQMKTDGQSRQEAQPEASSTTPASVSGSQDMQNDQDNMGATLRESACKNYAGQSPNGSTQISNRGGSFSSASIAEIEGEENRTRQVKDVTTMASIHSNESEETEFKME